MNSDVKGSSPRAGVETLPREIGILGSTAIVVGTIIGSGIFLVPHDVALEVGSVASLYLVWIVGGALALAGALSLGELGAAMPEAGGIYVYLREAYGKLFAFLYGWGSLLVIDAGSAATLAVAFGIYSSTFIPLTPLEQKLLGAATIIVLTFVNILGVRKGTAVQTIFTIAKLGGLAVIIGCAFLLPPITPAVSSAPLPVAHTTLSSFGIALVGVLWAYQGWHQLSYTAGEVKNPAWVLPRGFFLGTAIIVIVYLAANAAYLRVLPLHVMAEHQRVAATAMLWLLGPHGARFVSVLILCSIFGALNGTILTSPRVYYAMARDGVFFRAVARVHPRYRTPAVALAVLGGWATVLAMSGTFEELYTYVIFAMWIFSGAAIAGVIVLRRRLPDLPRPYRVWGYPILPVAFIVAALAIVVNTMVRKPLESFLGLALVLAGIPLYFIWRRLDGRR
ncbi:MAG TPA: amino acid permease [Terriglobia bacterium]|nr:amino acid permease [Terriglobia bacterium]